MDTVFWLCVVFFLCFIFNVMAIHGIQYAPRESPVQHNFLLLFLRLEIISHTGLLHRVCSCFNNRRWCSRCARYVLSTVLSDWCVLNHSLLEQLHGVGIVIFVICSRGTWSAERLVNVLKAVQLWEMSPRAHHNAVYCLSLRKPLILPFNFTFYMINTEKCIYSGNVRNGNSFTYTLF